MKKRFAIPLLCMILLLAGCGARYTEADLQLARESAYQSGYESGFVSGTQQCGEASYREGYSAGESAGFEAGRAAGYEEGLAAGKAVLWALPPGGEYTPGEDGSAAEISIPDPAESAPLLTLQPLEPAGQGGEASAPDRSTPSDSATVYITKSGTKYHRSGCSYLSSSKIEISLDDAKSKGYTPCSKCKPPQ